MLSNALTVHKFRFLRNRTSALLLAFWTLSGCQNYGCTEPGIAVDSSGNIITRAGSDTCGMAMYGSLNSSILSSIKVWPTVPPDECNSHVAWPDFALANDRYLYLLLNTWDQPNILYRIDLVTGKTHSFGRELSRVHWTRPDFITSDRRGRIYLASDTTVVSFGAPGSRDVAIKVQKVAISDTLPGPIRGFAAAPDGTLYFSVPLSNAVLVKRPHSAVQTLVGRHTLLNHPWGVAVDSMGRLYVANSGANYLSVYRAGAHGNTTPVDVIHGKDISTPWDIAVGNNGLIYVSSRPSETTWPAGSQSIVILSPTGTLIKRFAVNACAAIPL